MAEALKKRPDAQNNSAEVKKETKVDTKKAARKFAADELIACRSITYGELLLVGPKSKLLYTWSNYGDVTEVEYQDIQALKSTKSSYIFRPRFVIEDDELIEQWGKDVRGIYDALISDDIDELFSLPPAEFGTKLKNAPKGVQQAVKNIAGEKIMNGSLDSLKKIKMIDEVLGTDLRLFIE